jgi:hypothetical protein
MILKNRTYVLSDGAVQELRAAKIKFTELSRESVAPAEGVVAGERI